MPYAGYGVGRDVLLSTFNADERLSAEQLRYDLEEQGRDAATIILIIAIQLGIEQGRRILEKDARPFGKIFEDLQILEDLRAALDSKSFDNREFIDIVPNEELRAWVFDDSNESRSLVLELTGGPIERMSTAVTAHELKDDLSARLSQEASTIDLAVESVNTVSGIVHTVLKAAHALSVELTSAQTRVLLSQSWLKQVTSNEIRISNVD